MNHETVTAILPEQNKVNWNGDREDILQFKNYGNTMKHPFSIFIDFESTLQSTNEQSQETDILDDEIKTQKLQEHIPNSVGIKYNCIHPQYTKPIKIINNPDPEQLLKETIQTIDSYTFFKNHINYYNRINYLMILK